MATIVAVFIMVALPLFYAQHNDGAGEMETKDFESPHGKYTYATAGVSESPDSEDPYRSILISFKESDVKEVALQSSLEGHPLRTVNTNAFAGCVGISDVLLPKSVSKLEDGAFAGCASLKNLYFLGDKPEMGNGSVPAGVTVRYAHDAFGWDDYAGAAQFEIKTHVGGESTLRYYLFGDHAYVNGATGKEITIPGSIEGKTTRVGNDAFASSGLASVTVSDGVDSIGTRAFFRNKGLVNVVLPGTILYVMDEAFRECGKMGNVSLKNAVFIGFESFRACERIKNIVIPDTVTNLAPGAFRICRGAENIVIGKNVSEIGEYTFDTCIKAASVTFYGTVTKFHPYAFYKCDALVKADLRDATEIGGYAFALCKSLSSVDFGDGLVSIGRYCFSECASLEFITVPASVETIGDRAFAKCSSLMGIKAYGKAPAIGDKAFRGASPLLSVDCPEEHRRSWFESGGDFIVTGMEPNTDTPKNEMKLGTGFYVGIGIAVTAAVSLVAIAIVSGRK